VANKFLRSTDGSDADNGTTWALANATLAGAITDLLAGETLYVSDNHSESPGADTTYTFPGTIASPNKIICVDDTSDPATPTTLATTASVDSTGNGVDIQFNGCFYMYGMTLSAGNGGTASSVTIGNADACNIVLEECALKIDSTNSTALVTVGAGTSGADNYIEFRNCTVQFGNVAQKIRLRGPFKWIGGSYVAGVAGTALLEPYAGQSATNFLVENVDLSACGAGLNLCTTNSVTCAAIGTIRNCKLPASWSGSLVTGTLLFGSRVEMYNCDDGDTNYHFWIEDYFGSVQQNSGTYRNSGASDGTTNLSIQMTSSADCEFPHQTLRSQEIMVWNNTTGSKTVTVEMATDNVTLTDEDIWVEVSYLGTSGATLGSLASTRNVLLSATNGGYTTSSETWTGVPGTPVKQKMVTSSFTVNEIGPLIVRVVLARPSTTVYVDPKITVA
jgi:hypothetical protein